MLEEDCAGHCRWEGAAEADQEMQVEFHGRVLARQREWYDAGRGVPHWGAGLALTCAQARGLARPRVRGADSAGGGAGSGPGPEATPLPHGHLRRSVPPHGCGTRARGRRCAGEGSCARGVHKAAGRRRCAAATWPQGAVVSRPRRPDVCAVAHIPAECDLRVLVLARANVDAAAADALARALGSPSAWQRLCCLMITGAGACRAGERVLRAVCSRGATLRVVSGGLRGGGGRRGCGSFSHTHTPRIAGVAARARARRLRPPRPWGLAGGERRGRQRGPLRRPLAQPAPRGDGPRPCAGGRGWRRAAPGRAKPLGQSVGNGGVRAALARPGPPPVASPHA